MNRLLRPATLAWLALVAVATIFTWGGGQRRAAQIEQLSREVPGAAADDRSPTGYVHGNRNLILPDYATAPQQWIMDVQQMSATGSWFSRRAEYDNAPEGRAVHGASPYRWWLRLVAALTPADNPGQAVERAALFANAALQALLCASLGLLVAWRFGPAAGGLLSAGIALLFPFTAAFAAGRLDDHGLFLAANLTGWVLLLAGLVPGASQRAGWFLAAGAAAGLGLWIDAGSQLVILGATAAGAGTVRWAAQRAPTPMPTPPWRWWALGGAAVAVTGWLLEGRPGGWAGLHLDANHPWIALAWLALAEALTRLPAARPGRTDLSFFGALLTTLAPLAWLAYRGGLPVAFGPTAPVLTDYTAARSLLSWLRSDGMSLPIFTTLLSLALALGALWAWRQDSTRRPLLALGLGAGTVLLALGLWQLRWWGLLDLPLLGLLVVVAACLPANFTGMGVGTALTVLLLPGLVLTWPRPRQGEEMSPVEARALVERDLAQWLAARSDPGTIAFAPPGLSGALCYYGGLRVLTSPYEGNREGLALAVRIAGVASTDEAQALIQRRGIRYLVLPSWDNVLDDLVRIGSPTPERSLVTLLRQWLPPRWLRPVAYQLPVIPGLENNSVAIFEVVEPQENAVALSRLAEYFVETGRLALAAAVSDSLERGFAGDAGAMIARARVALARGESKTLAHILPELLPAVADGRDEDLPWERRASLALVLASAKHPDLARPQVAFCLQEADSERLRTLGPVTLHRLLSLAAAYRLNFADPKLRAEALALLPEEFRAQLPP